MVLHNKELNVAFLHIPKCGGVFVRSILTNFLQFNKLASSLHHNYNDFFDNKNQIHLDQDTYEHTIRKLGKYRFYNSHQDVDIEYFQKLFKFTFIRNPYEKLLSAFFYIKRLLKSSSIEQNKTHNTFENIDYYTDFHTFVSNYKNINNIAFSHAFITQYDMLIDTNGIINFNYIGFTENLNNELFVILLYLGITDTSFIQYFLSNNNKNITTEKDYDILLHYDEETFLFVNDYFHNDFDTFEFHKFSSYNEFTTYYSTNKKHQQLLTKNIQHENLVQQYKDTMIILYQKKTLSTSLSYLINELGNNNIRYKIEEDTINSILNAVDEKKLITSIHTEYKNKLKYWMCSFCLFYTLDKYSFHIHCKKCYALK